jgi:hypothetical protein
MQIPEVSAKLVIKGLYSRGSCGADFAAFLRRQYGEYGRIIREANIKAERGAESGLGHEHRWQAGDWVAGREAVIVIEVTHHART